MPHLRLDFDKGAFEVCPQCGGRGTFAKACDSCADMGKKLKVYNMAQLKRIIERTRYDAWVLKERDEAIMMVAKELGFKQHTE